MKQIFFTIIFTVAVVGCGGLKKLSVEKMLEASGKVQLPQQNEFPDAGAVILYEEDYHKLYLDSDWDIHVRSTHHEAVLYFSDKEEDYISPEIYLDPDCILLSFYARTIKPNGEIIELSKENLFETSIKSDFFEFTDDQSVKFTFPGVESGSVLEYSYSVNETETYWGYNWYVQSRLPKLYTKFTVEIPEIFLDIITIGPFHTRILISDNLRGRKY